MVSKIKNVYSALQGLNYCTHVSLINIRIQSIFDLE